MNWWFCWPTWWGRMSSTRFNHRSHNNWWILLIYKSFCRTNCWNSPFQDGRLRDGVRLNSHNWFFQGFRVVMRSLVDLDTKPVSDEKKKNIDDKKEIRDTSTYQHSPKRPRCWRFLYNTVITNVIKGKTSRRKISTPTPTLKWPIIRGRVETLNFSGNGQIYCWWSWAVRCRYCRPSQTRRSDRRQTPDGND